MPSERPENAEPCNAVAARVPSAAVAEMLAGVLNDQGIPARVAGQDVAYPSMDWAYGVQIRVPASRVTEARELIESEPDESLGDEGEPG